MADALQGFRPQNLKEIKKSQPPRRGAPVQFLAGSAMTRTPKGRMPMNGLPPQIVSVKWNRRVIFLDEVQKCNRHRHPKICALERLPEFRTMVGSWPEEQHLRTLADSGAAYIVVEDQEGQIAAFAILQGLGSENRSVELKRLVVGVPNQGLGKKLLTEVADRAFGEHRAHRLFLDAFVTNDRALHVYETFGFQKEGIMRDAIYRDGSYHMRRTLPLLLVGITLSGWAQTGWPNYGNDAGGTRYSAARQIDRSNVAQTATGLDLSHRSTGREN